MDESRPDNTVPSAWTRRHFVNTSAAGLAALPLSPTLTAAFGQGLPDLSQRIVINALGGISNANRPGGGEMKTRPFHRREPVHSMRGPSGTPSTPA